jgi:hypothetical protein
VIDFRCHYNIANFPFDTQNCTLVYGSWALTKDEILVTTDLPEIVTNLTGIILQVKLYSLFDLNQRSQFKNAEFCSEILYAQVNK